ncbi:MAG: hypothetical protein EXQ95_09410 [Alphaproteobacteria bacterium]|nr:hypothetical protein [Alphaproteobacteria bacterium]
MATPASAQMLGTMSRIAGPFAGRMAANGTEMAPLYGSQAGAMPHLMQGTQALMPAMNDLVASGGLSMARSSEAAVPSAHGTMKTPMTPNDPAGSSGEKSAGPEAPDAGEVGERFSELFIGACAGGAFIGAFSAVNASAPVAGTPVGATVVASAMAV